MIWGVHRKKKTHMRTSMDQGDHDHSMITSSVGITRLDPDYNIRPILIILQTVHWNWHRSGWKKKHHPGKLSLKKMDVPQLDPAWTIVIWATATSFQANTHPFRWDHRTSWWWNKTSVAEVLLALWSEDPSRIWWKPHPPVTLSDPASFEAFIRNKTNRKSQIPAMIKLSEETVNSVGIITILSHVLPCFLGEMSFRQKTGWVRKCTTIHGIETND